MLIWSDGWMDPPSPPPSATTIITSITSTNPPPPRDDGLLEYYYTLAASNQLMAGYQTGRWSTVRYLTSSERTEAET